MPMQSQGGYTTRQNQQRSYNGPNPNVAPGAAYGVTGSSAPDQWNAQEQYPPNMAGAGPTSILPHWVMAAVEAVRNKMAPRTWPTPVTARQRINTGYQAGQVLLPQGQTVPYAASPMLYSRFITTQDNPAYGGTGGVQMYSTNKSTMDDQPAFEIDPPIGQGRSFVNYYEGLNHFNPMRSGLPTWFPVGNRSANTNTGAGVGSHPVGVEYLVIPPDRYRRPNRAQPVRGKSGASGGRFGRSGTGPMYFGS